MQDRPCFHKVNRFVSHFRELEKQAYSLTKEEEQSWQALKEKLSASVPEEQRFPVSRRIIAIAGLYPRAGASFLAGNFAYYLAGKGIPTTLCEMPGIVSYYYFALDFERRAHQDLKDSAEKMLLLQNNLLRIKVDASLQKQNPSQMDITNWLLLVSKDSPCVIFDLSSYWTEESVHRIMALADEIWLVFDSDVARLTSLFLSEKAPKAWKSMADKIRIIANKWNPHLARSGVMKRVEGTVSLWDEEHQKREIDATFPLIDSQKVSIAQSKASLLLEVHPEEGKWFESLVFTEKGRML
jgi:hypothetical protein